MKKYTYITICMLFFSMFLIENLGLLDYFESAAADEQAPETMELEEIAKLKNGYFQSKEFNKIVVFNEPQPFYIQEKTFIEVGQLEPNLEFTVTNEQEDFYELLFGQAKVYVKKTGEVLHNKTITTLENTEANGAIKTTARTIVYQKPDTASTPLLQLGPGYRYPVAGAMGDWIVIKIGEQIGYIAKQAIQIDQGIPVLIYHHILPKAQMQSTTSTVSVEAFEQQMDYLAAQQFKVIGSQDIYEYIQGQKILPINTILITFDDGLLSTKEYAYPILKQHQFQAIQHIISSRTHRAEGIQTFDPTGRLQFFTAEEMALMSGVFLYEAHTHNLHNLNGETKLGELMEASAANLEADLRQNLKEIPTAISIAYPFGHYNDATIEVMKELGFLLGFTTNKGYANMLDSNYEINRFGITEAVLMADFVNYVQGELLFP